MNTPLFDAHLDLALNATEFRRDLTLSLDRLRAAQTPAAIEKVGTPTVTFDELWRGGVHVVVSTLLARSKPWARSCPASESRAVIGDYPTQDMAHAAAMGQLAWYRLMEKRGVLRIVTTAAQLREDATLPGVVLTMEGADPITEPDELHHWHDLGLRTLMLAHVGRSHYAHGTPSDDPAEPHDVDGPLTDRGRALLGVMHGLGMPLDLTHLSDVSLGEAMDLFEGRIYSSHSGCRAVCPHRRNHDDAALRRIVERGGVVGVPMFNAFLEPGYQRGPDARQAVTLDRFVDHVDHVCQLAGSAAHVGIGSDMDGGFGVEHVPRGIDSIADLARLTAALHERGFNPADVQAILSGNWLRFFAEALP